MGWQCLQQRSFCWDCFGSPWSSCFKMAFKVAFALSGKRGGSEGSHWLCELPLVWWLICSPWPRRAFRRLLSSVFLFSVLKFPVQGSFSSSDRLTQVPACSLRLLSTVCFSVWLSLAYSKAVLSLAGTLAKGPDQVEDLPG